jgi:hypothetical protein
MIPPLAHFIWFGDELPWIYAFAVQTAVLRGGFQRVVLHHADDLSSVRWWHELQRFPAVETRPLRAAEILERVGEPGPALLDLYQRLKQPAARANLVRAALLFLEGGVYLDIDTVTLASLEPLRREAGVFCGAERLVFPGSLRWHRNPLGFGAALGKSGLRDLMRRLPDGWLLFRRLEHLYPTAANNAVLGAESGHPLLRELLERMVELPRWRQQLRYELGTTLLQTAVAGYGGDDLVIHEPGVFYPLGPEISQHWFRHTRRPRPGQALRPETRVVHWYASVRTRQVVAQADPPWVRAHAGTQLFSALALPLLQEAEQVLTGERDPAE